MKVKSRRKGANSCVRILVLLLSHTSLIVPTQATSILPPFGTLQRDRAWRNCWDSTMYVGCAVRSVTDMDG